MLEKVAAKLIFLDWSALRWALSTSRVFGTLCTVALSF